MVLSPLALLRAGHRSSIFGLILRIFDTTHAAALEQNSRAAMQFAKLEILQRIRPESF